MTENSTSSESKSIVISSWSGFYWQASQPAAKVAAGHTHTQLHILRRSTLRGVRGSLRANRMLRRTADPTTSHERPQVWEEQQLRGECPAIAKEPRTGLKSDLSIENDAFWQIVGGAVAKACLGFVAAATGGSSSNDVQSSRGELMEEIASVQARMTEFMTSAIAKQQQDFDGRTSAILERQMQNIRDASKRLVARTSCWSGQHTEEPFGRIKVSSAFVHSVGATCPTRMRTMLCIPVTQVGPSGRQPHSELSSGSTCRM